MRKSEARAVLGLVGEWGPSDVKRHYRRLVAVAHPDVGGDAEAFRRVQAAYELLEGGSSADPGAGDDNVFWSVAGQDSDYRVATGAMTYLAVEPDLLDHLAEICNSWEGQIADLRKSAVRQMAWLAVGVLPIGAVISAAKAQKYRSTGGRFLAALRTVKQGDGMRSASAWDELGRTYVAMLGLLDLDAAAASVDLTRYTDFVRRLERAIVAEDNTAIDVLMREARQFGQIHDLRNFADTPTSTTKPPTTKPPTTKPPSKSATQRLAYAVGRRVGSRRR